MIEPYLSTLLFVLLAFVLLVSFSVRRARRPKPNILQPDRFLYEVGDRNHEPDQLLVIYSNGYWQINTIETSTDWSPEHGIIELHDGDDGIDVERYIEMTGEPVPLRSDGSPAIQIIKEVELKPHIRPEDMLANYSGPYR